MKIFIVGRHWSGEGEISTILKKYGVTIAPYITNSPETDILPSYKVDINTINTLFENGSYIFLQKVNELNNYYKGISQYDFDENDVVFLSPNEFISIPEKFFKEDDIIIWLDNTLNNRYTRYKFNTSFKVVYDFFSREENEKLVLDQFDNYLHSLDSKIVYFSNEEPERIAAIVIACQMYPGLAPLFSKYYN